MEFLALAEIFGEKNWCVADTPAAGTNMLTMLYTSPKGAILALDERIVPRVEGNGCLHFTASGV